MSVTGYPFTLSGITTVSLKPIYLYTKIPVTQPSSSLHFEYTIPSLMMKSVKNHTHEATKMQTRTIEIIAMINFFFFFSGFLFVFACLDFVSLVVIIAWSGVLSIDEVKKVSKSIFFDPSQHQANPSRFLRRL